MIKSNGPKIDPCGTPSVHALNRESVLFMRTLVTATKVWFDPSLGVWWKIVIKFVKQFMIDSIKGLVQVQEDCTNHSPLV